ncbi:MAG: aminotransferase class V-fold PLP-dependent enzyme [Steroidobacteraceae bacterium]
MSGPKHLGFDTLALHGGQQPDPVTGARAQPIYQSVSFVFNDTDEASSRFDIARSGYVYSRIGNPTVAVLEERLAMLEGGVGAVATASGMAAIHLAITTLAGAGDHIVASRALYGGTHNLLSYTLPRFGIKTTFVDPRDPDAFAAAVRPETRLVFAETVANPRCEVLDIEAVAARAHEAGLPLVIDSTLTTPHLLRPLEHGADIVVHSLTKFIGGHGTTMGGAVVDGGRFDWLRWPQRVSTTLTASQGSTGSASPRSSSAGFHHPRAPRLRISPRWRGPAGDQRVRSAAGAGDACCGWTATSPMHASWPSSSPPRPAGSDVTHPASPDHPDHARARRRLLPRGAGAVFSFEIGAAARGRSKLIESLNLFSADLANVGDAKVARDPSGGTTHARMDDDFRAGRGGDLAGPGAPVDRALWCPTTGSTILS